MEWSFDTQAPRTLRVAIEGYDRNCPPAERLARSLTDAKRLAKQYLPSATAEEFTRVLLRWGGCYMQGPRRFGAFLGLAADVEGLSQVKVYPEVDAADPIRARDWLPDSFCAAYGDALVPVFAGLVCGRRSVERRMYFAVRADTCLRAVTECAGERFDFLTRLLGRSSLPAGSLILTGNHAAPHAVKVEISLRRLEVGFAEVAAHLGAFLENQETLSAFRAWAEERTTSGILPRANVLSQRYGKPGLTLYVSPAENR